MLTAPEYANHLKSPIWENALPGLPNWAQTLLAGVLGLVQLGREMVSLPKSWSKPGLAGRVRGRGETHLVGSDPGTQVRVCDSGRA